MKDIASGEHGTSPTAGTETSEHDDAEAKAKAIEKIRAGARLLKNASQNGKKIGPVRNRRVAMHFTDLNGSAKSIAASKFLRSILAEEDAAFLFVGSRIDSLGGLRIFVGCSAGVVSQNALREAELIAEGHRVVHEDAPPAPNILHTRGLVELPGGGFGTLDEYREALAGADSPAQQ